MSTSKSTGASRLGRDSIAKRLGVKLFAGQKVRVGMIIIRQRGSKYLAGKNVKRGGDDTLYAGKDGTINFTIRKKKLFDGRQRMATIVNVE